VIPSKCLIAKSVNTESKSGHAANDTMGEVNEHVFLKYGMRTYNQGPVCRWRAPLVVGELFIIIVNDCALSDVCWRKAPNSVDAWS